MSRMKHLPPLLLVALVLLATFSSTSAQDEDGDDADVSTDPWKNKECTISSTGGLQLGMRNAKYGRSSKRRPKVFVRSEEKDKKKKKKKSDDDKWKWIITPVTVGKKKYFEIKNKAMKSFMKATTKRMVTGTSKSYSKTKFKSNLWTLSPSSPGKAVTIKSVSQSRYLVKSISKKNNVRLRKVKSTTWTIKCQ